MASQKVIICVGCNQPKGTTNVQYDKLLAEDKITNYLCRSCRPKKTKPVSPKVKMDEFEDPIAVSEVVSNDVTDDLIPPMDKIQTPRLSAWMKDYNPSGIHPRLTEDEYKNINTCFRPDIFTANKRKNNDNGSCDGCPMFEYCGCLTKALKKV